MLSYISTREFLRTLEKCEKHSPSARASRASRASPHFSSVLKNSRVLIYLNNARGTSCLFLFIIQLLYTVRIPIFWLVDLYHVTLGYDRTTSLT